MRVYRRNRISDCWCVDIVGERYRKRRIASAINYAISVLIQTVTHDENVDFDIILLFGLIVLLSAFACDGHCKYKIVKVLSTNLDYLYDNEPSIEFSPMPFKYLAIYFVIAGSAIKKITYNSKWCPNSNVFFINWENGAFTKNNIYH